MLNTVAKELAETLTAGKSAWQEIEVRMGSPAGELVSLTRDGVGIYVPTSESPAYEITLESFHGGRRLLSDETAMLEGVALITSRQIDAMRVVHERCDREFREQEFSKLATEAQLAALRSQINPHFLFNALTTIGYLIQTAPEKAFETLLHLTKLLRSVLNSSSEFCTVADELKLIESYLDIERARFEERLHVTVDVPSELKSLVIPSLILQPLVENSIKHSISENKNGGRVKISASLIAEGENEFLELCVADSGPGDKHVPDGRSNGVGLKNVSERLSSHYGTKSEFSLRKEAAGTTARIKLPVSARSSEIAASIK